MVSLQPHRPNPPYCKRFPSASIKHRSFNFYRLFPASFPVTVRGFSARAGNYRWKDGNHSFCCFCKAKNAEIENVQVTEQDERPPFDINLAVVLAGFAFEAYTTPPENIGRREVDAADCATVYLSESFVREIYDGQLFVKLKKGVNLPAMDPWGTSDPYVVMELDGQVVKSNIKWGSKEPTWNEDFTFNVKKHPTKNLQVAAWDANIVTPHKRMGNAGLFLENLCDGSVHEVLVELEGMGGGGKLQLEVKYKTFDEIEEEKKRWKLPFVTEFLRKKGFDSAFKMIGGSESVPARQFVEFAFGQLKSLNDAYLQKDQFPNSNNSDSTASDTPAQIESTSEVHLEETSCSAGNNFELIQTDDGNIDNPHATELVTQADENMQSDEDFWKNFANVINQTVVQKLGLPVSLELKWDGFDLLNRIGLHSQEIAEAVYVESGLATARGQEVDSDKGSSLFTIPAIPSSIPDIKKATQDVLSQTDSVLGAWMVLTTAASKLNKEIQSSGKSSSESEELNGSLNGSPLDETTAEEMKTLFSTAESAMEAWAMLATSLGQASFIRSEFEKLCFLDNASTDTQVAIWRDSARRRLVVAFRGTEQTKWKDLLTDMMLAPAGLNPERIGGDFKEEVQRS